MTVDEGQDVKIRFKLQYQTRWGWPTMTDRNGAPIERCKTIEEAKAEKAKAIKRHKPYGRDFTYRIVMVTEVVVG